MAKSGLKRSAIDLRRDPTQQLTLQSQFRSDNDAKSRDGEEKNNSEDMYHMSDIDSSNYKQEKSLQPYEGPKTTVKNQPTFGNQPKLDAHHTPNFIDRTMTANFGAGSIAPLSIVKTMSQQPPQTSEILK